MSTPVSSSPALSHSHTLAEKERHAAIMKKFDSYSLPTVPSMTPSQVALRMREDRDALLIVDTRSQPEWQVSKIPGAVSSATFEEMLAAGDIDSKRYTAIVCYCTLGVRSAKYAARTSAANPQLSIYNMPGSILSWVWEGGEEGTEFGQLVDSDGNPTKECHVYGAPWDLLPDGFVSRTFGPISAARHAQPSIGQRCIIH